MSGPIVRTVLGPGSGVPLPVAPYSHAVSYGGLIYVTGQMPIDPASGQLAPGGIAAQTHQVMSNLKAVLEAAGSSLERALYVRAYLSSFSLYEDFNAVYAGYFAPEGLPARTCVAVSGMAVGADLEIDMVVAEGEAP